MSNIGYRFMNLIWLLSFYIGSFEFAQTQTVWSPSGATWYYTTITPQITYGYTRVKYVGDSFIGGKLCKVMEERYVYYNFWFGTPDTIYTNKYTYMENDSIFYYDTFNSKFHLMYDFTAAMGDIWEVAESVPSCFPKEFGNVQVDQIDSVSINGFVLRKKLVSLTANSHIGFNGEVMERIGNHDGYLFPTTYSCLSHNNIYKLRCYRDDTFGEYKPLNAPDCDFFTGLAEDELTKNGLKIYPIPAQNSINVELSDDLEIIVIRVVDVSGRLLRETFSGNRKMDVSWLSEGIYMLEIVTDEGNVTGRFVKSK